MELASSNTAQIFDKEHNILSIHHVSVDHLDQFQQQDGILFSKFKYLDPYSIDYFAQKLADMIWEQFRLSLIDYPEKFVLLSPAHRHLKSAGVWLTETVHAYLKTQHNVEVQLASMSRRAINAIDFGKLQASDARQKLIAGNFYYSGPSLDQNIVILIEDAVISGTHWIETQRVLVEENHLAHTHIHCACLVNIDAQSFSDGAYSVEDVLNHLWVDPTQIDRFIDIIKQPQVEFSTRSIKFLLNQSWSNIYYVLERLTRHRALRLCHQVMIAIHKEKFEQFSTYQDHIQRLQRYVSVKLLKAKSSLNLKQLVTLDQESAAGFFERAYIPGEDSALQRDLTLNEAYSLMKFADRAVIDYFAQNLARLIHENIEGFTQSDQRWAVAAPGYTYAPGSARILALRVAHYLKKPCILVNRNDVPEVSYGTLDTVEERFRVAAGDFVVNDHSFTHHILIDDAVVSGSNLHFLYHALQESGSQGIYPFCIVNVVSPNFTLEEKLNASIIHSNDLSALMRILKHKDSSLVMRSIKLLLRLSTDQVESILTQLPLQRWIDLLNIAALSRMIASPSFRKTYLYISDYVNQVIRRSKIEKMPPYLPFLIAADHNTEELMQCYGAYYSGLKYGDPQCITLMSEHILQLIRVVFGNQTTTEAHRFCIAGSNINYIPNAASHLAQYVAKKLNLPIVDLRAPSTYVGEFGALKSIAARADVVGKNSAFVSNPSTVQGKIVIYIDDCVVSGAHLADQVRALQEAQADQVRTFCIFDVAGQDLSLEAQLNYALIDANDPIALIEILKQKQAPLLARSPKVFLRLPSDQFLSYISQLPTWRLFDIWEQCQVEGFSQANSFQANITLLKTLITDLHHQHKATDYYTPDYQLLVFDYDDTMADVLTVISDEMSAELVWHLQRGAHLCIISTQPIGQRGLTTFFFEPFKAYLQRHKQSLDYLQQIHLLPCEGMLLYQATQEAHIQIDQPRFNLGFHHTQWQDLQQLVLDHSIKSRLKNLYLRDSYISLHFNHLSDLQWAQEELQHRVLHFRPQMHVIHCIAKDPSKHVLHVRLKGMSKYVGRDWVMQWIKPQIEQVLQRPIERHEILVAGDRMGYNEGYNADQKMMILGACNLALGDQVHPWVYADFQGMNHHGLLKFLRNYRLKKS
jgi:predicted amidophosphoribosyltransferase